MLGLAAADFYKTMAAQQIVADTTTASVILSAGPHVVSLSDAMVALAEVVEVIEKQTGRFVVADPTASTPCGF